MSKALSDMSDGQDVRGVRARSQAPAQAEERGELEQVQLYTCRYLAEDVLSSGEIVPVRISYRPPIVPLAYPLEETAETLLPEFAMLGEWDHLCQTYRHKLDTLGVERIGEELSAISARHGGRPLALLDYEDLTRGLRNHRIVFSHWWEEKTGQPVFELINDGATLHYSQLPSA